MLAQEDPEPSAPSMEQLSGPSVQQLSGPSMQQPSGPSMQKFSGAGSVGVEDVVASPDTGTKPANG